MLDQAASTSRVVFSTLLAPASLPGLRLHTHTHTQPALKAFRRLVLKMRFKTTSNKSGWDP